MSAVYAIPSAELPDLLLSESAVDNHLSVVCDLIRRMRFFRGRNVFYEPLIIDGIFDNNMAKQFLQQFLVADTSVAASADIGEFLAQPSILARMFSRARKQNVETSFISERDGIRVSKRFSANAEGAIDLGQGYWALGNTSERWYPGELLEKRLERLCLAGDWQGFESSMLSFFYSVFERFAVDGGLLAGDALDAIPRNCIVDDDIYHFFDLEYRKQAGLRQSFLIFRSCLHLFNDDRWLLKDSPYRNVENLYQHFCERMGLQSDLEAEIADHNAFMRVVLVAPGNLLRPSDLRVDFCGKNDGASEAEKLSNYRRLYRKLKKSLRISLVMNALFGVSAVGLLIWRLHVA